jgi:hypothetical protein
MLWFGSNHEQPSSSLIETKEEFSFFGKISKCSKMLFSVARTKETDLNFHFNSFHFKEKKTK